MRRPTPPNDRMGQFDSFPTVGESADDNIGLRGHCGACKKERYWPPAEALAAFGRDAPIKAVEARMKCSCGATGASRPGIVLAGCIRDFYAQVRATHGGVG